MEEVYAAISDSVDLWKLATHSTNEDIEATECWLQNSTNKVNVKPRTITPDQRDAWLDERQMGDGDEAETLIARFVWISADQEYNRISLAPAVQDILLDRFGLHLAHRYFRTFYSGVTSFPRVTRPGLDQQAYAFCYGPKLAAIWSRSLITTGSSHESILEGMFFSRVTPPEEPVSTSDAISNPAYQLRPFLRAMSSSPEVCRSSALPAYLFSLLLCSQMNTTQAKIAASLRKVESRTGYHGFSRFDEGFTDELAQLSAKTSGHAGKLAGVKRKSRVVGQLLDFISETTESDLKLSNTLLTETAAEILRANVRLLRGRLDMQMVDVDNTLKRVEIQIEALFHLISQKDAINNFELALWTKNISLTSQRDAASMKTLAVVTMFFLPGSFISALFSTQMFAWDDVDAGKKDSIGVLLTPQFRLYWAVTIPLTLVTFLLYFIWLFVQAKRRKELEQQGEMMDPSHMRKVLDGSNEPWEAENSRLAKRRLTLFRKEGLDV